MNVVRVQRICIQIISDLVTPICDFSMNRFEALGFFVYGYTVSNMDICYFIWHTWPNSLIFVVDDWKYSQVTILNRFVRRWNIFLDWWARLKIWHDNFDGTRPTPSVNQILRRLIRPCCINKHELRTETQTKIFGQDSKPNNVSYRFWQFSSLVIKFYPLRSANVVGMYSNSV